MIRRGQTLLKAVNGVQGWGGKGEEKGKWVEGRKAEKKWMGREQRKTGNRGDKKAAIEVGLPGGDQDS